MTQLQRQSDVDILLRGMLGGTADVENYCSLTLSVRGEDLDQSEIERATEFFTHLKTIGLSEHIISVAERGDQEDRLHLQTMISGDWSMRKCNTVEMKKVIDKQNIFKRPYILKVQMHKLDENRTRLSLCGCGSSARLDVRACKFVLAQLNEECKLDQPPCSCAHQWCLYVMPHTGTR